MKVEDCPNASAVIECRYNLVRENSGKRLATVDCDLLRLRP
jgi:hypothetical protein